MLNKKLAGLFVLPALLLGMSASHALSNTASQTLQATLGTYLDITALTSGAVTSAAIAPDTGNLATALVSKFQVNLNTDTQQLFLQATTNSSTGSANALFQQGTKVYVVFSNTATGKLPTTAAISDCKAAAPTAANNANAIAYPIASIAWTNGGIETYDATKNQYNVTVKGGTTVATITSDTTPYANTYSFADNSGTYQAVMTLTSTTL